MEYRKVCVEVEARFSRDGGMRPMRLIWEDGRKFEIDRVKFIERAASHVAALLPVRYTCVIGGKERAIWFESELSRWFVEILLE